ncbi:hypothetical protein Tco_0621040 [Tanacetum coccineum]
MTNVKKSVAERTRHQRQYDRSVYKRQIQTQESTIDLGEALNASLVVMESNGIESGKLDTSSRSKNDTNTDDADIRPIYDEVPMAEGNMVKILNETSNKAKIKKEIDAFETINIELEHSVAKLLTVNEHLNKENETLKKHYKDLYDSIKITRAKTIEQTTLITQNADLKAQIQEKAFAIAAMKNELRKSKGNSVDTKFAKPPFASQVDVEKYLSKPVTQQYLPKGREYALAKPHHMIASSASRNSSKNMPKFSSNDMVHNHYLEEAKKKTQEKDKNSKSSVMPSTSLQNTTNGSKPKPRINKTTWSLPTSKSSYVTSNVVPLFTLDYDNQMADKYFVEYTRIEVKQFRETLLQHMTNVKKSVAERIREALDASLVFMESSGTKSGKQDTSSRSGNDTDTDDADIRPIYDKEPMTEISPNKTSTIYEKTSPRSDLRWQPTGRINKTVGLKWIPTGKLFDSYTRKADSESTHGSNIDISKIHECKQSLNLSVGTSINVQNEKSFDLNAGPSYNVKHDNLRVWLLKKLTSHKPIVSDEEIYKQKLEAHSSYMAKIQEVSPDESSSTDTPLEQVQNNDEKNVFANERQHSEKHAAECADERAALANLIANLTLDTEENKTILKQLKKANASLTQELKECKTNLDESSRALGEATSSRDSSLIALQTKQTELEKYTALNDLTSDYKILQTKLNETLGLLARKDIDIQEGLKTKTYEISVVNQKHDELVKKSLLTRSQFEGQLKEKTKVISDLKVKEGKDIDTMIEMDKQIKFLNEILYKRNQSIQTIHMLAPKCATYNGRSTFANPKYLKKAQSDKPRLYEIPYDTSDPANRFCPNGEETVTLEKESRSKLDKDKEMKDDLEYVNSLEKEIDELESEKADFSNIYDLLLEECLCYLETCKLWNGNSATETLTEGDSNSELVNRKVNGKHHEYPVSNKDFHLGEHRKQSLILNSMTWQCPTCKKCLYSANHDECVLEYLSKLNPRASAQIKDAKSHNTTKRYVPVEKTSESKKPERLIPKGHRWVPTGKIFAFSTSKVDSEPTHGSIVDIPHIQACKQTLGLSAGPVPQCSNDACSQQFKPRSSMSNGLSSSPDDEEDTRSNQEYMDSLEEEYQARALLAKSKRFFKKGTQRFSSAKATDQTECHKCDRMGYFARDCFSKISVPSYQSPFQNNSHPRLLSSLQHKPELKPSKDFEAKCNKVKAKLALLSSSASACKSSMVKNIGLVAEEYE